MVGVTAQKVSGVHIHEEEVTMLVERGTTSENPERHLDLASFWKCRASESVGSQ